MAQRRLRGSIVALISLGLAGFFGCSTAPGVGRDSTAAAIDEAEARFRSAIAGDPASLETLLADDFFYLTAEGSLLDKRGLIEHLRSGATRIDRIVKEEGRQVRRDGLVVTTGHSVVEVRLDGHATRIRSRHLHVWVEEAGGWRLLARQADMKRLSSD
ncbi:MAG: nuclear transport factor 2 family protein [Myxococcota bacterium]